MRIKAAAIVALALASLLQAGGPAKAYVIKSTNIFTDPLHAKAVGVLEVGASVTPLKETKGWREIRVEGWQQEGMPSVIFAFEGKRVVKAMLTPEGQKRLEVLKQVTDPDTGLKWKKVALRDVWIHGGKLAKSMDNAWQKAAALYEERCSMCHALPKTTEYTANQWPATLRVMSKRAALNRAQTDLVAKYLQYHAKDTANLTP